MTKRTVWGVILIALGIMATLQSIDKVQYNFGLEFWPVVWTLIGGSILWSSMRSTSWFGIALGLWIGGSGLLDILHNAQVIGFDGSDIISKGWPLLLVAIGLSVLFGKKSWWNHPKVIRINKRGIQGNSWSVGDMRYGHDTMQILDKDLDLSRGIGDVKVDLTGVEITEGIHKVNINGGIGDVKIRVPDNVTVRVDVSNGIGRIEAFGESREGMGLSIQKDVIVPESTVELHIEGRMAIGDLRMVQGPAAPRIHG